MGIFGHKDKDSMSPAPTPVPQSAGYTTPAVHQQPEWMARAMHSAKLIMKSGPAVDLSQLESAGHVDLVKKSQKFGINLSKQDLTGFRAQGRLYVDHSGSMEDHNWAHTYDYSNGNVEALVHLALAYMLQIDPDGKIPVIAFDSVLWPAVTVGVVANEAEDIVSYEGVVEKHIWRPNQMGGTNFSNVFEDILKEAKKTTEPLMITIITDGSPADRDRAKVLARETAAYPVFIKFLSLRPVDYLKELDDLTDDDRLLDNIDSQPITDPKDVPPMEAARLMTEELSGWTKKALGKGTLTRA